jgi:hypothetical protein
VHQCRSGPGDRRWHFLYAGFPAAHILNDLFQMVLANAGLIRFSVQ